MSIIMCLYSCLKRLFFREPEPHFSLYPDPTPKKTFVPKKRSIKQNVSPVSYYIPNFQKKVKEINMQKGVILKLVSWNVNGKANSAYTPKNWSLDKYDLIYEQVSKQNPDIICYQELKSRDLDEGLIQKYHQSGQWFITKAYMSHAGFTRILVHTRVQDHMGFQIKLDCNSKYAGIILRNSEISSLIKTEKSKSEEETKKELVQGKYCQLMLYGCHLPPFNYQPEKRRAAFNKLYEAAKTLHMQNSFVLMGDTNMRYKEEKDIVQEYGQTNNQVHCCWDIVPEEQKKKSNVYILSKLF